MKFPEIFCGSKYGFLNLMPLMSRKNYKKKYQLFKWWIECGSSLLFQKLRPFDVVDIIERV